ncbi:MULTISPECIES: hypothetical protein [unclassified Streptomyces]|uniref:hypothetical protein n=1 Tax=unclassified Streptomyces TaxID=2593676 RepID=UPI0035D8711C
MPAAPHTLLLDWYDHTGALRYADRATPLARTVAPVLAEARTQETGAPVGRTDVHRGWGSRNVLDVELVSPQLVVEVGVDVVRNAAGRRRHPVRLHRVRGDLSPDVWPLFGA